MGKTLTNQTYSLIHWANQDRDPIDIWIKTNQFMLRFGEEYVFKLSDGAEFDVSYVGLTKMYQTKRQKRGGIQESISYGAWSQNSLWLRLSTGVISQFAHSSINLPETLIFEIDLAHLQSPTKVFTFSQLQAFFKIGVILFDPFYSRLQKAGEVNYPESTYERVTDQIDNFKVPAAIEWFNYFSPAWVERFGGDEFVMSAPVFHSEKIRETGGIILILQEEPFNYMNSEHMIKRKLVEEYLGLPKLQQLHRR